ncbi:MAG: hypothetical protein ACREHE_07600 [Rhizomicrobium sp.]
MTHPRDSHRPASEAALLDLIAVLRANPRGLRRWSVMRAMRARATREITPKFEDDVERTFRRHCEGDCVRGSAPTGPALFHRPKDTAGEVWALYPDKADAWLAAA